MLNKRSRIKICGITQNKDATLAIELGADALGFIFYKQSSRYIEPVKAKTIVSKLPPFVSRVGVFVNECEDEIKKVIGFVGLDILQFHGNETGEFCRSFNKPYIKAIPVRDESLPLNFVDEYFDAAAFLFDTATQNGMGGSGETFNWSLIPSNLDRPIIIAGGLNPENVRSAILQTHPYAVDVTSGVEVTKGKKDPVKLRAFIQAVISTHTF